MDILFIDPPWIIESDSNLWKTVGSCLPSLGIAYMASYLEREGYKVKILDSNCERISVSDIGKRIKEYNNPKFIGITATSALINNALSVARICKDVFPSSIVVMGGVHPSVMPDETLSNEAVDLVVRDEGEMTMSELVSGKRYEDIDGLSYYKDGKVTHNPNRKLIENLDDIPPPAYHLLSMDRYYPAVGSYKRLPAMSIFATRGCPGRCIFCYRTFYGRVRKRSAESIIKEIELLQRDFGIREIAFYDDTFTCFKKEVKRFVELLLEKKIDITWSCFSRPDHIDKELLKVMKKGGCHLILFGVESADEKILETINKRISLTHVKEAVRDARKIGIETRASFMFGNPGETEETVKKTINFAIELDPDEVQFNITTAYPGTELYKWAKEKGYLDIRDNKNFNMSDINMKLPTISSELLDKYYKASHKMFYLRPRIIIRRLLHIRSFVQLAQEIKGFLAILKFLKKPS
jgi:radical SAM superfamily enzyme YgiQ (UPF0313 family)